MALSIAVLAAAIVGLFVRPADAVVYTYSLVAGDTRTYAMSLRVSFTPQGIPGVNETLEETVKGRMTLKVADVRDDGSMTIELKLTNVSVEGENAAASLPDYQNHTMKMRVSKSGEVLAVEGASFIGFDPTQFLGAGDGESKVGSSNLFPVFPPEALEPGDTWTETDDTPLPFGNGNLQTTIAGKHLGFVESRYGRAARMNVKMSSPIDLNLSFADIMKAAGEALPKEQLPADADDVRMIMNGALQGDMTAQVIPDGGDLVKMVMLMKMNIAMRFQGLPAEAAAAVPLNLNMLGNFVMKLDRIA